MPYLISILKEYKIVAGEKINQGIHRSLLTQRNLRAEEGRRRPIRHKSSWKKYLAKPQSYQMNISVSQINWIPPRKEKKIKRQQSERSVILQSYHSQPDKAGVQA